MLPGQHLILEEARALLRFFVRAVRDGLAGFWQTIVIDMIGVILRSVFTLYDLIAWYWRGLARAPVEVRSL